MAHRVIITIPKGGDLEIEVDGIKGPSCKDITKALEKSLGTVTDSKKKAEFYEQAEAENRLRQT